MELSSYNLSGVQFRVAPPLGPLTKSHGQVPRPPCQNVKTIKYINFSLAFWKSLYCILPNGKLAKWCLLIR